MKDISYEEFQELRKKHWNIKDIWSLEWFYRDLLKGSMEAMLEWELDNHLWYEKYNPNWKNSWNNRNGYWKKKVITNNGQMDIQVPRDRNSTFDPALIPKRTRDISDFEEKIIGMYGLWLSTSDITQHIREIYHIELSESQISQITNRILTEIHDWQNRPLSKIYPVIFLDAIHFKVRADWHIINKACYIVLWIDQDGQKDIDRKSVV